MFKQNLFIFIDWLYRLLIFCKQVTQSTLQNPNDADITACTQNKCRIHYQYTNHDICSSSFGSDRIYHTTIYELVSERVSNGV